MESMFNGSGPRGPTGHGPMGLLELQGYMDALLVPCGRSGAHVWSENNMPGTQSIFVVDK